MIMKFVKGSFLIMIFSFLSLAITLTSCEEEEIEISGDSALLVKNEISISADIYFDGDYIGDVDGDDSRRWSVPSGNHTVKADCSYKGDVEKSPYFPVGGVVTITLYEESQSINISY